MHGKLTLDQTLPSKRRHGSEKNISSSYGATDHAPQASVVEAALGVRELLKIPVIRSLCASGFALSFIGTAFDVIFVLFCYSPIDAGGLNFTVRHLRCPMSFRF